MYPLNDKDLDRLSREAAEQYDVESSTGGWDLVENRLNTEMPVKAEKERRRFLFWLFFIALMAGGGLVYMLGGTKTNSSVAQQRTGVTSGVASANTQEDNSTTGTKSHQPEAVISQTNKNTKDNTATNQIVAPRTKSKETVSSKTIADKVLQNSINNNSTVSKTRTNIKTSNTSLLLSDKAQVTRGQKNKSNIGRNNPVREDKAGIAKVDAAVTGKNNRSKDEVIESNPEKIVENSNVSKGQQQNDVATNTTDDKAKVDAPAAKDATSQKDNADKTGNKTPELTASVKKPTSKSSAPIKAPLEIGFLVGPDQSYVKFKYGDNTGLNLGVTVGYRFSNRWSVNTGIILEKKNYTASGEDFTNPKRDWTSSVKMNAVDGACSMFDIPLNVRYDLSYNDKRRFFVSTGLTSYLMHHQAYDYYYTNTLGQNVKYPWYTDSSMNYFMSVLNLSVGFERTIGKHLSFQVEPYLKVPLKGLGYGSMKLDSYGAFFSLKYKPEFGKRK